MKSLIVALMLFFSYSAFSDPEDNICKIDASYGVIDFVGSSNVSNVSGNTYNIEGVYYLEDYHRFGLRSGFTYCEMNSADNYFITVPIHLSYYIKSDGLGDDSRRYDNFGQFIFFSLLSIIPTSIEFETGFSNGYIEPCSTNIYTTNYNNPSSYILTEKISSSNKFISSFDLGVKLNFHVFRCGISVNVCYNYIFTNNFKCNRYQTPKITDLYYKNAMRGTVGFFVVF